MQIGLIRFATFGRYLSDEIVDSILETPEGLKRTEDAAEHEIQLSRQYPNPEVAASYGRGEALEGEDATIDEIIQYIPKRYNEDTTLKVDLKAGDNQQPFDLTGGVTKVDPAI